MENAYIIVLGNPGPEYALTVHNAGWIVVDALVDADAWQENKYAKAIMAGDRVGDTDLLFIKPETFMNESGQVIDYLHREYNVLDEEIIVIYDDIDLPLGTLKISHDRGDGGHNGIKSIVEHLGSRAFTRIRVGVSRDLGEGKVSKPNVLKRMTAEQVQALQDLAPAVGKAISIIASNGYEKAMNQFN